MKRIFIFLAAAMLAVGVFAESKRISPTVCGITIGQTTSKEILDKIDPTSNVTVLDVQKNREVYIGNFNVEGFKMSVMSVELANDTIYQINFYEQSPYVNYWQQCKEQVAIIRNKYANYTDYYHSTTNIDSLLILDKSDGTTNLSFACFPKKLHYSLINLRIQERMHQKMMDELQRASVKKPVGTMGEGHLKFKGVEIDGTPQEFVRKMKEKGLTYVQSDNGSEMMSGDFAGFKDCVIGIKSANNKVSQVIVIIPVETESWKILYNNYSTLKEMLTAKYGNPTIEKEEWQSRVQPHDDNSKLHEVKMNRATFGALYEMPEGSIELLIYSQYMKCCIMLNYVDSTNQQAAMNSAIEDL